MQHVQSKKFLSVCPRMVSDKTKGAFKIELGTGSENSWFRINACYKMRRLGSPVVLTEPISLQVVILKANSVTATQFKATEQSNLLEVCCSPTNSAGNSSWLMTLVTSLGAKSQQTAAANAVRFCSVLRLMHTENSTVLTAASTSIVANPTAESIQKSQTPFFRKLPDHTNISTCTISKSLWRLEATDAIQGRAVTLRDKFRLRHLLSGGYLGMRKITQSTLTFLKKRGSVGFSGFEHDDTEPERPTVEIFVDMELNPSKVFQFMSTTEEGATATVLDNVPMKLYNVSMVQLVVPLDRPTRPSHSSPTLVPL